MHAPHHHAIRNQNGFDISGRRQSRARQHFLSAGGFEGESWTILAPKSLMISGDFLIIAHDGSGLCHTSQPGTIVVPE